MPSELPADIMTRLQASDKNALRVLFEQHYPMVCQTIHRFIEEKALVEDLAQEVFIRFWEKREQITINASLPAYLRRMAINEALAWLRRHKRYEQEELSNEIPEDVGTSVEDQYLHVELQQSVNDAINTLPPKCRAVFQLSRFEELTYQEIADKMGLSIKTVENQMGKALRMLRERLRTYLNLIL